MFKFISQYFATNTSTSTSSREYPFNIHYRTAYKKCWIDKIKNKGYPL